MPEQISPTDQAAASTFSHVKSSVSFRNLIRTMEMVQVLEP